MALYIDITDSPLNKYPVPDPTDQRALNADRITMIFNKVVNGDYRKKEHGWTVATRPTSQGYTVTFSTRPTNTVNLTSQPFSNGTAVSFRTTATLPDTVFIGTVYYVVNAATNTFQIANTVGGVPLVFATTATGTNTVYAGLPIETGEVGFNSDFQGLEMYTTYGWQILVGIWSVATRPPINNLAPGSRGWNTDVSQYEFWDGSQWRSV